MFTQVFLRKSCGRSVRAFVLGVGDRVKLTGALSLLHTKASCVRVVGGPAPPVLPVCGFSMYNIGSRSCNFSWNFAFVRG